MGSRVLQDQQAGFAGGLNTVSDPAFLRPDQARQMANFRLSSYGAALKRLGTQLTTAAAITTFSQTLYGGTYWPSNGEILITAAATNSATTHLYKTIYPAAFPATWSDIGAINQFIGAVFSDGSDEAVYFGGDPNHLVQKYNGSTISTLTAGTAQVRGLCVYNDRLWGWNGNSLYYSNLSSAVGSSGGDSLGNASAGGGQIIVRTFGESDIAACAPVNGSLLIFHERGTSVLTGWGQDDIQVQPQALNAQIGMSIATPNSMCVANTTSEGDVAYFVSDLGMFMTNGGYMRPMGTTDKPDPIAPLLLAQTIEPYDMIVRFCRQFNEIWVIIKDTIAGTGGSVYVYNVILQSWSGPFTGTYTSGTQAVFEVVNAKNNTARLWRVTENGAAGPGVFVSECDRTGVYVDDTTSAGTGGTAVTAALQLHRFFCGDRAYAKTFRWINILATLTQGATPPTLAYANSVNGSGTITFGTTISSAEKVYYLSPGGTGVWLDATITDAGTTGPSQYALATVQANFLGQR